MNATVTYNQVGVALYSEVKFAAGQMRTAANGQQVPTVLTYTDALGGKPHYLSAQAAGEIFDVYHGVSWNAKKNCIDFDSRADTSIIVVAKEDEAPPPNLPEGTIVITTVSGDGEKKPDTTPTKPELNRKAGPYTEIAPSSVQMNRRPIVLKDGRLSESSTGLDQMIYFAPENGTDLVITVTNHSKVELFMNVMRPYTIGNGANQFGSVKFAPGKTMVRALRADKDIEALEKSLRLIVNPHEGGWATDVTYTVEQFRQA